MSKFTTGELAKLCGVSVRTVQFYDNKGVLCPSELSEGGRRLYSQEDLNKMRIICYLKELGLPQQQGDSGRTEECHPSGAAADCPAAFP